MQFRPAVKSQVASGFTLVELSIVLVIIGLIIGGVLVGRDLINSATIRSQIAQIEKYNAAVNTFRGKYGYLPGDIPNPVASQYGFVARGQYAGEGDGNGVLEAVTGDWAGNNNCCKQATGENPMFWMDLSTAKLIDGGFSSASPVNQPGNTLTLPGAGGISLFLYFPVAKIGQGNFIFVFDINRYLIISAYAEPTLFPSRATLAIICSLRLCSRRMKLIKK